MERKHNLSLCDTNGEVWRDIVGYEGFYQISSSGRVKSLARTVQQRTKTGSIRDFRVKERIIPNRLNDIGYPIVVLTKGGHSQWLRVHRLLAQAFLPNPDSLPEVDHIDNDKTNMSLNNLRWVTHRQNMNNETTKKEARHKVYNEQTITKRLLSAKRNGGQHAPKTIYQYSLDGALVAEHFSIYSAAKSVGRTHGAISEVLDKPGRKSAGFMWRTTPSESISRYKKTRYPHERKLVRTKGGEIIGSWDSIKDASKELGIHTSTIHRNLHPHGGNGDYQFYYKEDF